MAAKKMTMEEIIAAKEYWDDESRKLADRFKDNAKYYFENGNAELAHLMKDVENALRPKEEPKKKSGVTAFNKKEAQKRMAKKLAADTVKSIEKYKKKMGIE